MSEIFLCDRCGEAFEVDYGFARNGIRKIVVSPDGYERSPDRSFVLCSSCMAALNDWLKGNADAKV